MTFTISVKVLTPQNNGTQQSGNTKIIVDALGDDQAGQEVEATVTKVDKVERPIGLSIKAVNYNEEDLKKEARPSKHSSEHRTCGSQRASWSANRVTGNAATAQKTWITSRFILRLTPDPSDSTWQKQMLWDFLTGFGNGLPCNLRWSGVSKRVI